MCVCVCVFVSPAWPRLFATETTVFVHKLNFLLFSSLICSLVMLLLLLLGAESELHLHPALLVMKSLAAGPPVVTAYAHNGSSHSCRPCRLLRRKRSL